MQNISQVEDHLKLVMEERAPGLARETGCIQRERKFDGAALLQMLVFGWLAHPVNVKGIVSHPLIEN